MKKIPWWGYILQVVCVPIAVVLVVVGIIFLGLLFLVARVLDAQCRLFGWVTPNWVHRVVHLIYPPQAPVRRIFPKEPVEVEVRTHA